MLGSFPAGSFKKLPAPAHPASDVVSDWLSGKPQLSEEAVDIGEFIGHTKLSFDIRLNISTLQSSPDGQPALLVDIFAKLG